MTREEIHSLLQTGLAELFDVPREQATLEARLFEDLNLDSIDAVELVVWLQRFTGRRVNPEDFKAVRTVGDVITCVAHLVSIDA